MRGFDLPQKLLSIRRVVVFASVSILAFLVCSCATSGFKDAAAVNLELHFYKWDSVCITKPDTRENGFLPVLDSTEVAGEINKRKVPRNLATVVIGTCYDEGQAAQIGAEWKKRLGAQGFKRVVALRGNDGMKIDGLPIVTDSAISSGHDSFSSAITDASAPPAP